jgi:hypothetical protein
VVAATVMHQLPKLASPPNGSPRISRISSDPLGSEFGDLRDRVTVQMLVSGQLI